jgi:hypothetical protein
MKHIPDSTPLRLAVEVAFKDGEVLQGSALGNDPQRLTDIS